jgi:membrane-associated protease RseP (regulator of RpoE activity)
MKTVHLLTASVAVLLSLLNSPSSAQESAAPGAERAKDSAPADKPAATAGTDENKPHDDRSHAARPSPRGKPTPFIGVLTSSVSPEVRAQLGLPEGFGVQVVEVMPESPAKEAGVKVHDILVKFGDQQLVNMEQLQALVRSRNKGDEVTLAVISGGKESTVTVRIGEQMMPERPEEPRRSGPRFFQPGMVSPGGRMQPGMPTNNLQESVERFQHRLREYQERLQQWSREGHRGPMPNPPVFEALPPHSGDRRPEGAHPEVRRESTSRHAEGITRRDESGVFSLQRHGDTSTFSVRPKHGGEQSWTFSSDSQRAMIPEQYREKLRLLEELAGDMHRGGGEPAGGAPHPRPSEEDLRQHGREREPEVKQRPPAKDTL